MGKSPFALALAALLAITLPATACINEVGTNHHGELIRPMNYVGQRLATYLGPRNEKKLLADLTRLRVAEVRKSPSFPNLIDLSSSLIYLDRLSDAAKLLEFLEQKYPGHFETAANLGTTYELMGRNEEALKWILEGIKRNPEDHAGTEWLHVLILKAKLGRIAKPARGQSILGLDFGTEAMPIRPSSLPAGNYAKPLPLYSVALAIRYQLLERLEFVAPPDPMLAALLLDWANLELLAGTMESADVLYDAALRYGSREKRIIDLRKAQVAKILEQAKKNPTLKEGTCELCEPPRLEDIKGA